MSNVSLTAHKHYFSMLYTRRTFFLLGLACIASPNAFAQTNPTVRSEFDKARLEKIADDIEAQLKDRCVGYSFVVAYRDNDRLAVARAGGVARRAPDSDPRPMRTNDRISIASVSKVLTAITLIKLLDEKKISVDSPISPYLPKEMTTDSSVSGITFRQLLTHTSGLRDLGEADYATLKRELSVAIKDSDKVYKYQNGNFGIMRLLIPIIEDGYTPPATADDYTKSYLYGIRLMQATQKRVFTPIGIRSADCKNPAPDRCLSYQFPQPVQQGTYWGDMTASNAYRGWVLSADEMSRVIRALLYTEKLLTKAQRETMLSGELGIFHATVAGQDEFGHNGMHPGNPIPGKLNLGEVATTIAGYSNGVSVALFVNSQIGSGDSTSKPIRTAIAADIAAHQ